MSDPNMIMNFANNQPRLLTGIGQGLRGLGQQAIQQKQQRDANEAYTEALGSYTEDGSEENLLALYEAAGPVGKFDQIKTTIADMDSLTQKNQLQQNMEYYSGVISGNSAMTIDKLEADALANENDGDVSEAKQLRHLAQQLREGKDKEFISFIGGMSGLLEGGPEAMANIRAEGKYTSDQIMTSAQIFKTMEDLEVDSIEERGRLGDLMEGMSLAQGKKLSEMIQIAGGTDPKNMTSDQFAKLVTTFRKEYTTDTEGFRVNDAVKDKMNASLAQDTSQGDVGSLFLFMKMLDENSVVRESEFKTASNMGSLLDSLKNTMDGWATGQRLQPDQKKNLERLTTAFYDIAGEKRKLIDDRMRRNTAFFGVEDDLVFLDYDGEGNPVITEESEPVPDDIRAFYREKALNNPKWTDKERKQIEDPNTPLSVFKNWSNTWKEYGAVSNASGTGTIPSVPIIKATTDDWSNVEVVK